MVGIFAEVRALWVRAGVRRSVGFLRPVVTRVVTAVLDLRARVTKLRRVASLRPVGWPAPRWWFETGRKHSSVHVSGLRNRRVAGRT